MSFYANHTKKKPSKEAKNRVSRQMQALNARIKSSAYEQSRPKSASAGFFKVVLGNVIRVKVVAFNRGRSYLFRTFVLVGILLSTALTIGMVVLAGYIAWRFLIPLLSDRLNLPIALSTVLFAASVIHFEGSDDTSRQLVWRWGLQHMNLPIVRLNRTAYLGINVVGGVIPIAIALYQLTRVPWLPALLVILIVAAMSYFSARVIPTRSIFLLSRQGRLIAFATALVSTALVSVVTISAISQQPLGVPIAFAGCVVGSLIGVDLLHLKDLRLKQSVQSISIGGAGLSDGLLTLGLMALLIAEYFPKLVRVIDSRFSFTLHYPLVSTLVSVIVSGLILRGCYQTYLWTLSKGAPPSNRPLYLGSMAASYAQKGRYEKAEKLYKKAIALSNLRSEEDYHHKITNLIELAFLYSQQDRFAEAELAYQQALPLAKQYAAYNPSEVLAILFNFAQLCERQQRYTEARRLYVEALSWIDRCIRSSIAVDDGEAVTQAIKTRLTDMVLVTH